MSRSRSSPAICSKQCRPGAPPTPLPGSSTSGALPLLSPAPNDAWAVAATLGFSSFGFLASRFLCCPRAKIMQRICHDVLKELGIKDSPLLEVAMALEKIALNDEYFIEKKLYPNIDFYSGITLKAMGFPVSMFTVLFAVARTAGWIAQWKEMIEDPTQKIGRPRQLYIGPPRRDYVPVDQRSQKRLAKTKSRSSCTSHGVIAPVSIPKP